MRIVAALAALLLAATAAAQPSLESGTVLEAAERLKAGEYIWAPQVAPEGPVLVVINRATQRLVVYRNGVPIGISTVSTGRPGYATPTGIFTVLQKRVEHYSTTYDNAPMPYMQRLTWRGVALHAGNLPGHPASHGCIRLPHEFARRLYEVTRLGTTVVIADQAALPGVAPEPELLLGRAPARAAAPGEILWNPQASPSGPVSIVVSAADRRVVVLRNGRVIGSAPAEIRRPIARTTVYMLRAIDEGGAHWLRIPLPGQAPGEPPRPDERDRVSVDEGFAGAVRAILAPGTTVIVTGDALRAAGGQTSDVLQSDGPGTH